MRSHRRGYKLSELRNEYLDRGVWKNLFKTFTRSKHGRRVRRTNEEARWWNRLERRSRLKLFLNKKTLAGIDALIELYPERYGTTREQCLHAICLVYLSNLSREFGASESEIAALLEKLHALRKSNNRN